MKMFFEPGDIVTLAVTETGADEFIGVEFTFVSYLQTPFSSSRKRKVILDCVVYNKQLHILMPAKSQNLKLIKDGKAVFKL